MLLVFDVILEVIGLSSFFIYIIVKGMHAKHRYMYTIGLLFLLSLFCVLQQTIFRYIPISLYYVLLIYVFKKS